MCCDEAERGQKQIGEADVYNEIPKRNLSSTVINKHGGGEEG